ncbi:MAG: hypothetical protein J0L84_00125 [Verrucomicrobia bacterium]|nr:hypothetical protein [Verrucomicrobiota bacterium]
MRFGLLNIRWLLPVAAVFGAVTGMLGESVLLHTGETLSGTVVSRSALELVLETPEGGRVTLPMSDIARVDADPVPALPVVPAPPVDPIQGLLQSSIPTPQPAGPSRGDPIPMAARPSLPEGTNFVARAFWDGRLRYQLSTRLALKDPFVPGSTWVDNRIRLRGRVGMKLALDAADFAVTDGQLDVPGGFQVRTFRVLTEGEFGVWQTNQYNVELGLVGGEFFLARAYWRLVDLPHFGDLTVGYFAAPQTLDNLMGFGTRSLMEPSAGTAAFSPGNRVGVQWNTTFLGERMTAAAGIFSVGQNSDIDFGNASDALAQPVVRLTGLVWDARERWLHLGASAAFIFSEAADIQYQARPESRIAPFLVNTGSIDARTAVIGGLEAVHAFGPVLLQAEFMNSAVYRDGDNVHFLGGYLTGGWMLTGESRPYNRFTGLPTRVRPRAPLWGPDRGWGAWEVVGRASLLSLNDGPVQGGRMRIVMGGLNWYWNEYLRWQLNAGYAAVSGGPTPGNLLIFEGRFEGQF